MILFLQAKIHTIKQVFFSLVYKIFFLLFKDKAGEKTKLFIENFSYVAFAEIIGSLIGFPVKILAGRYLGPIEYGKYSLILNLAQFLIIPMIVGFGTAALRYIPLNRDHSKGVIGLIQTFFFITWSFSIIFFVITKKWWIFIFDVPADIFWWALGFSALLSLYNLYESFNRGMHKFKLFAYITVINSTLLVVIFSIFLFGFGIQTYQAFIITNICAFAISLAILVRTVFKSGIIFSSSNIVSPREILHYSGFAVLGGLTGFIIGNADKFFVNHYLSIYWVGVYAAYVNASAVFIGRFFQLFINVYFPTISGEKDKTKIDFLIKKIIKISIIPIFCLSFVSIWFIIWLFGEQFPIKFDLIILFSLANCLHVISQLFMWFLNSQGVRGLQSTIKILATISFVNLFLLYIFVQMFGIIGAVISTIVVNLISSIYFYFVVKRFFKENYFNEKTT